MPKLKRAAVPTFASPTPGESAVGMDDVTTDWIESAVLLGTFAAGMPVAGALINMQLNLLFKGASSNQLPEFWQQAKAWIQDFVHEEIEAALWTYVLEPTILSIGQAVERIADEAPVDQFGVYNGTIPTECDFLHNNIYEAATSQPQPPDYPARTKAFSHLITIAVLDLTAWQTLIRLDVALNRDSDDHKKLYQDRLEFYKSYDIRQPLKVGFWHWRNHLVGSPVGAHQEGGAEELYVCYDSFFDPGDPRYTVLLGLNTSGKDAEDSRAQYVTDVTGERVTTWEAALDHILDAFEGKIHPAPAPPERRNFLYDGDSIRLGTTDPYSDDGVLNLGPVYPNVQSARPGPLGTVERRGKPEESHGLFHVKRQSGRPGRLQYGDVVTLQSKDFPLYICGVSPNDRAQTAAATDPDSVQWSLEAPDGGKEGKPLPMGGHFRLKNKKTGKWLAWKWPEKIRDLDRYYFALIPEATGIERTNSLFTYVFMVPAEGPSQ